MKAGTYRIDAYEVAGIDTCKAGSRLVTVVCDMTVSGCNIRIKAVDSQQTETDVMPRVGGILQPLLLSVEHLEGASLAGYTYQWTRSSGTGAAVNLATTPTVSATSIGEYAVKLISGTDTCTAYLTVRSKPCTPRTHTYACGTTPAIPLPDNGSRLSNLAPGDTIRAADFDIIVTEVTGGGSEGWNGVGYTELPYLQCSRIAIELKGVVVNDCYELVGGTAQSAYDPSSFGTVNAGSLVNVFDALEQTYKEVQEFLRIYSGTAEDKAKLSEYINRLESLKQTIVQSENLQSDTKTFYENLIDTGQELLQCSLSATSSAGGRLSATQMTNTCSIDNLQAQFDQQKEQLAQNAWVNLPDSVPVNELSFEECISRISYKELTNTLPGGDKEITIHILGKDGVEVTSIIATIRGSFYRFTYNNVEYYYAKALPECTDKKVVLVHQYGDNSLLDGIFSYYDFAGKKYVPFFPKGYPDLTIEQMVQHYSRGFDAFADVTEQVFVNTLTFIAGGGPVGGRIVKAVEWLAFAAEQYAALQAPNWKNTPEGEYYEKANIALLFYQLGTSINEIRQLKNLSNEAKEAAEQAKRFLDDGEVDRIIQEAQEYANSPNANPQFREYMERLAKRIGQISSRFAKSSSELKAYLSTLTNKPIGRIYKGSLYKSVSKISEANYNAKPDMISDYSIEEAWGRYDLQGESAMYYSNKFSGNQTEMSYYGDWNNYSTYEFKNIEISNMLDLTDIYVRKKIIVNFEQLTKTDLEKEIAYEFTNVIGTWARGKGYKGLIVPGARGGKDYENIIIFNQEDINVSLKGKLPLKLK